MLKFGRAYSPGAAMISGQPHVGFFRRKEEYLLSLVRAGCLCSEAS